MGLASSGAGVVLARMVVKICSNMGMICGCGGGITGMKVESACSDKNSGSVDCVEAVLECWRYSRGAFTWFKILFNI